MTLVRYQPWSAYDQLHREINRLFDAQSPAEGTARSDLLGGNWTPTVDIKDETNAVVLMADIPGVEPGKIEVTANNGVLTIKGERAFNKEWNENQFRRVERSYGSFYRQFTLPDNLDAEQISAKSNHGVLEVRIPKRAAPQSKRVTVES